MSHRKQAKGALYTSGPSVARTLSIWPSAFLADAFDPVPLFTPHRIRTKRPDRVPAEPIDNAFRLVLLTQWQRLPPWLQ